MSIGGAERVKMRCGVQLFDETTVLPFQPRKKKKTTSVCFDI